MIKNILTIIALSLLGLCLFVGLAKNAKNISQKQKNMCDIICSISVFSAVVLIAVVQLLGEEKKSQGSSGGGEEEKKSQGSSGGGEAQPCKQLNGSVFSSDMTIHDTLGNVYDITAVKTNSVQDGKSECFPGMTGNGRCWCIEGALSKGGHKDAKKQCILKGFF